MTKQLSESTPQEAQNKKSGSSASQDCTVSFLKGSSSQLSSSEIVDSPQSQKNQYIPAKMIESEKTEDIKEKWLLTKKVIQKVKKSQKKSLIHKKYRSKIREKWRARALQNVEAKILEPGFKEIKKQDLRQKDLAEFELMLDDESFYGKGTSESDILNQYTAKTHIRQQSSIKKFENPVLKKHFKILSFNMSLGNPVDYRTFVGSNNYFRTEDFINYFIKAYNDGFDFVFLQELSCWKNIKMVSDAIKSGSLPYFCSPNILPKIQRWKEERHLCYHTVVFSRYPVKFGDFTESFVTSNEGRTVQGKKTFRFIEFKILIHGEEKVVRMLSSHLKANWKPDFDKPTIDHQFVRDKEIDLLKRFSSTCDQFFVIGDFNIGNNPKYYQEGNDNLKSKFVDFLEVDSCKSEFEKDTDCTKFGTYMWHEEGVFSTDRMDRALVSMKGKSDQEIKEQLFAHVEVENPELSSCKGKGLDRIKVFQQRLDHCNFISLSDHSALKCVFGFNQDQ